MPSCQDEYDEWQNATTEDEREAARQRYYDCIRLEEALAEGRAAHGAAWDEKLYLLYKEIQASWDRLFGRIKVPPVPSCGARSVKLRKEIFESKGTAMRFSHKLAEAFLESGISLKDDETFACSVCVVKKPQLISEALALDPLGLRTINASQINYILEPAVMAPVLDTVERDKINYNPKGEK
jgi:hypothetical protein